MPFIWIPHFLATTFLSIHRHFELLCSLPDILSFLVRNLAPEGDALLLYPDFRIFELQTLIPKTPLDIFDLTPCVDLDKYYICHIRCKGTKQ